MKAMAPHSSTLAWKIPWMEEPGRLQSMGSLRVRHDWTTLLWLFTFMHWRRKWQPTSVFLPRESQGWGSLVGCRLWGRTESDTTEATAAAAAALSLAFSQMSTPFQICTDQSIFGIPIIWSSVCWNPIQSSKTVLNAAFSINRMAK